MSTIERVMGRAKEDVREWTTDKLDDYVAQGDVENLDTVAVAASIARSLSTKEMLTKEQAKWLRHFLTKDMNTKLEDLSRGRGGISLADVDELSIYADAWGLYCRPGTYSI